MPRKPKKRKWSWELIKRFMRRLLREHSSPSKLAGAVWVGMLVGASPFFGFHYLIAIGLATLFGLNRPLTFLASNISIPPIAPFIVFGSIQVGSFALSRSWLSVKPMEMWEAGPLIYVEAWLLGSLVVGALVATPFAVGTFFWARRAQGGKPEPAP
jgi:uncharacterized protein (DUF2062 family)